MSTRYKVLTFDLAAARTDPERALKLGLPIHNVVLVDRPPAAPAVSIRLGDGSNSPIPVNGFPIGASFKPHKPEKDGLFITNAAGAASLVLLVSFEDGPLDVSI